MLFLIFVVVAFNYSFFLYNFKLLVEVGGESDLFASRMGNNFDPTSAIEIAINLVICNIFDSKRLERLAAQKYSHFTGTHNRKLLQKLYSTSSTGRVPVEGDSLLSLSDVLEIIVNNTFPMIINRNITSAERNYQTNHFAYIDIMNDVSSIDTEHQLEVITKQSVIINQFILSYSNSLKLNSPMVQYQLYRYISILIPSKLADNIEYMQFLYDFCSNNVNSCVGKRGDIVTNELGELISFYRYLQHVLSVGKPFMQLLPTPVGPPI